MAASVFQYADVVCASKSGSVKARATCRLTAEDEFGHGDVDVTDATGHEVWVGVACRN
jgi:hypothetical protein